MTATNGGNNKIVKKKKAKSQVGTATANDNATAKKKKTKSRVETVTTNDKDVPKKKIKTKDQTGVTTGNNNDIVKKKKKTKTRTEKGTEKQNGHVKKTKGEARTPAGNDSSTPKKKKWENQNVKVKENATVVKKSAKGRGANETGNRTATKKKKMKSSAEKASGKSNDTSRLPQYTQQSTPQDPSVPMKNSPKVGGDRESKRSRRKSILCISIPVILLLLCLVAGVVLWQLGIFPQKDESKVISKTTARMVVLEVTERKLTPLEINQDNVFDSGGAEEQALPGKR